MTALDLIPDVELASEPVTKPERKWWRNKMRAKEPIVLAGQFYDTDEFFQAGPDYPTKDTAQEAALEFLSGALDAPRDHEIIANVVEYVGAIPFDERST